MQVLKTLKQILVTFFWNWNFSRGINKIRPELKTSSRRPLKNTSSPSNYANKKKLGNKDPSIKAFKTIEILTIPSFKFYKHVCPRNYNVAIILKQKRMFSH